MKFWSALAVAAQRRARRLFASAAFAVAAALSGSIGLGFLTYALFEAVRAAYGQIDAAIAIGAIYIVLAGILWIVSRRAGALPPAPIASERSEAAAANDFDIAAMKAAEASIAPQAAVAIGVEIAKQLTPLQLTLLAAFSGFVAGRKL